MAITRTDVTVNLGLDAQYDRGTGMKLKIYSAGSGVPANAGVALTDQVLLAGLVLANTPFGAAAGRVKTANAITSDSDADATGIAAFARLTKSDDTVVDQCSVSASGGGGDAIINSTSIVQHTNVSCLSLTRTAGA